MNTRTSWLKLFLIIGAAIAVLAVAACGGGDDNTSSNTPAASSSNGSGATGSSATNTAEATAGSTDSNDVLDQLAALGNDIDQVTGKVSYNVTDADGSTSTFTLYAKPPKSRIDSTDSSDNSTTSFIETEDASYTCESTSNSCLKTPATSGSSAGLGLFGAFFSPEYVDALVSAARAQGIDVQKSSENIAGTDADCYSGTETDGTFGKFCFGNGLMLYTETTDSSGTTKLEATSFSSDVSDSDFEPPYPVTDLSSIPTG